MLMLILPTGPFAKPECCFSYNNIFQIPPPVFDTHQLRAKLHRYLYFIMVKAEKRSEFSWASILGQITNCRMKSPIEKVPKCSTETSPETNNLNFTPYKELLK